ncbi:hypothetical protein S40293_08971 [Stachybotrys chartarum IBT 40293]|nr:hypothetical protein S40293_08971 [Stachybotrys chartarum IBT 40293]
MSSAAEVLPWLYCPPNPTLPSNFASCSTQCWPDYTPRMASGPSTDRTSSFSLEDLSSELIALLCEWMRDVDPSSLWHLRLVSRRLNAVATPIAYRVLRMNEALLDLDAEQRYPQVFDHISAFTTQVIVRSDLEPAGIRRVLARVDRLSKIQWHYVDGQIHLDGHWIPSDILNMEQAVACGTRLSIEGLPLREFKGHLADAYLRAVPTSLLVSLKLRTPAPLLTARLDSLRLLLVRSSKLEEFHYEDRGQGTSFRFEKGERMPALKELALRSYDWDHTPQEVRSHWDFSNIRTLRLVSVPSFNFLRSVPFSEFAGLQTLQIDDYSAHLADRRQEATGDLYTLVKENIRALRVLDITCHTESFPLDAILQHSASLQVLRFRNHVGFGDENRRCPTMAPADLAVLASKLSYVHSLELDMDVHTCDPTQFLQALSGFPSLREITLHMQTVIGSFNEPEAGEDADFDMAMQTFRMLLNFRRQAEAQRPWKRVTINVGGWKRVMARRASTLWRERNARGVFAERCFVLQKSEEGEYGVHEELSVEASSRTCTPERQHAGLPTLA